MNKNQIFKIIIFFISSLFIILSIYFISNYNKFQVYIFSGKEDSFSVSGNATFTKDIQVLNIYGIKYNETDIMINKIKISLIAKINTKDRMIYSSEKDSEEAFSLTNYLNEYSYSISEQYGYNEYFNKSIIKNFKDIIYLKIEITEATGNNITKIVKLHSNKYTNNKWFYRKTNHI